MSSELGKQRPYILRLQDKVQLLQADYSELESRLKRVEQRHHAYQRLLQALAPDRRLGRLSRVAEIAYDEAIRALGGDFKIDG